MDFRSIIQQISDVAGVDKQEAEIIFDMVFNANEDKNCKPKMDKLPEKIKILWGNKANHCETQLGKTFTLFIQEHHDKDWKGYWSLMYELEGEMPPLMPQMGEDTCCFLCSMGKTYMEAENELIDRLERAKGYWEESRD